MTTSEPPLWRTERDTERACAYRIHRDGRVVAYGPEVDGPSPNLWRATAWTADPRTDDAATYRHLCADATLAELDKVLDAWATGEAL